MPLQWVEGVCVVLYKIEPENMQWIFSKFNYHDHGKWINVNHTHTCIYIKSVFSFPVSLLGFHKAGTLHSWGLCLFFFILQVTRNAIDKDAVVKALACSSLSFVWLMLHGRVNRNTILVSSDSIVARTAHHEYAQWKAENAEQTACHDARRPTVRFLPPSKNKTDHTHSTSYSNT